MANKKWSPKLEYKQTTFGHDYTFEVDNKTEKEHNKTYSLEYQCMERFRVWSKMLDHRFNKLGKPD